MWWITLSLVLLYSATCSVFGLPLEKVSCKNREGNDIDWFIIYKTPVVEYRRTGLEYMYFDSTVKNGIPIRSAISDGDGPLGRTLQPMLRSVRSMLPTYGFLSYSDQPPGAEANDKLFGHSKGVVMGDSFTQTALWITHSTPQFPFRRDQNRFWPDSGNVNGQSFMCVSLPFSELKGLREHLQNIQAYPYDYDLPDTFPDELKDAAKWVTSSTSQSKLRVMHTRGNQELNLMAKPLGHNASDGDLYVKLANAFNSDMSVQTWGCQRGGDKSFCPTGQWKVMNVEEISTAPATWKTEQDHSKWGVTTRQNIAWTCFGDVNRSESQYQRWGGALCINDAQVNAAFKRFIRKTLLCHKRPLTCPDSDLSDATRTASFG